MDNMTWRVTVRSYEDGETWSEDYVLRIDAERRVEAAEENGDSATLRRVHAGPVNICSVVMA